MIRPNFGNVVQGSILLALFENFGIHFLHYRDLNKNEWGESEINVQIRNLEIIVCKPNTMTLV